MSTTEVKAPLNIEKGVKKAINGDAHVDEFARQVSNNGVNTIGEYRVALPDGRVQVCVN